MILEDPPTPPDWPFTRTPATFPASASTTLFALAFSNCSLLTCWVAYPKDFSLLLIPRAVTTTPVSSVLFEFWNETVTDLLPSPAATSWVPKPKEEIMRVLLPSGTLIVKLPLSSVTVPDCVPLITTLAPSTASPVSSRTRPLTTRLCAKAATLVAATNAMGSSNFFINISFIV
ncbi:hypothetical protein D3C72_897810 [compost metagenome]